jgi:hypothetical protein
LVYTMRHVSYWGSMYLQTKRHALLALKGQIDWLETFPAGFKLNVPLTYNMGYEIRNFLHYHEQLLLTTFWNPQFGIQYGVPLLAVLTASGGWTMFLAIVVDVWRLENLHLVVMTICFRQLYLAELYLLSALFRLFRGQKRNILRQRTDSMEYDAMQLLVGTIAFCICVLLWTTLMVYYTFFAIWNWIMHVPVILCWVLYVMSRSFPWGSLIYRLRHPSWFPQDLYLKFLPLSDTDPSSVQITALRSIVQSTVSILFSHIATPLSAVLQWSLSSLGQVCFPHSDHPSPVSLPLKSYMREMKNWELPVDRNQYPTNKK